MNVHHSIELDVRRPVRLTAWHHSARWAAIGFTLLLGGGPARAALPAIPAPDSGVDAARLLEAARVPTCVGEEQQLELARYRDLVATAPTLEKARERATFPSRMARRALTLAGLVQRDDSELDQVRARLAAYEERVARAKNTQDAASEFEGLVRLAGANVSIGGGCSYSTSEIVAIIFGFILFIVPGIILLIVFC